MITGKGGVREELAKIAILNFRRQNYKKKRLIIINEGETLNQKAENDVLEIIIKDRKEKQLTLGELRNMAFEFIPEESIWTTWDDDDWRSDGYLSFLKSKLGFNDYVFFTRRVEYNMQNGFTWIMELKSGFVIMFGRKKWDCLYAEKDYNEDIPLKNHIMSNLNYKIIENEPYIYIRTVHGNNTSVMIKPNKSSIANTIGNKVYFEHAADDNVTDYVNSIISKYFRTIQ
jgi:hypothetical protein